MRTLSVTRPVRTPSGFAMAFLRSYFDEQLRPANAPGITLRVPIAGPPGGLSIDKTVAVEVHFINAQGDASALEISWSTPESAAFPRYCGSFSATPTGPETASLTLEGTYSAPGGVAGSLFDAAVGGKIARSTVEELLQVVVAAAESDYQTRLAM